MIDCGVETCTHNTTDPHLCGGHAQCDTGEDGVDSFCDGTCMRAYDLGVACGGDNQVMIGEF